MQQSVYKKTSTISERRSAARASTMAIQKAKAPPPLLPEHGRFQQAFRQKVLELLIAGRYKNLLANQQFEVAPWKPFFAKNLVVGDWALKTIILWVPHLSGLLVYCPFCPDGTPGMKVLPGQVIRYDEVPLKVYTITGHKELVSARYKYSSCQK